MTIDMDLIQRLTGVGQLPAEQAALFEQLSRQLVNGEALDAATLQAMLASMCHGMALLARAQGSLDAAYAAGLREGKAAAECATEMSLAHDGRDVVRILNDMREGEV